MTPVVVVHGLWMPGSELVLLRRRLARAGFAPRQFRYRSLAQDLDTSADRLAQFLARIPAGPVHVVGHSLGGVLMLRMIERHGAEGIGRLVALGSPFLGSATAKNLLRWPLGPQFLGRAMLQWLDEVRDWRWDGIRELGIVAGSRPLGAGRFIGPLPKPNDGTVCVAETGLSGAADHIVLPVTHFSMLYSRAVADQVIEFLRNGSFER